MNYCCLRPALLLVFLLKPGIPDVQAQGSIDTTSYFIVDSVTGTSTDWSGYIGWTDTVVNTLSLLMDSIDEKEYVNYKTFHLNPLRIDSGLVSITDSSFSIRTGAGIWTFTTLVQDDKPWAEYNGWLDVLQLHIVTSIDGGSEFGTLMLIDGKSGKVFYMDSGWDSPCAPPVVSPDGKYLITFANTNYETDQSRILIHRIRHSGQCYKLELIHAEILIDRLIDDVVWMDKNCFVIAFTNLHDPLHNNTIPSKNHCVKATLITNGIEPRE